MIDGIEKLLMVLGGIVSLAGTTGAALFFVARRFASIELKVGVMWEVMMNDSRGSLMQKGFAKLNSPLSATIKGIERFPERLVNNLRSFYSQKCIGIKDSDAALLIASEFCDRINAEVCFPSPDLDLKECLALAVLIAKGSSPKADSEKRDDTDHDIEPL